MEPIIWLWNTFEHIAISWCYPKILKWDRLGIEGNFNFWHFIFEFEDDWRDEDDLMKARGKTGRREPVCRQNLSRSSPVVPWIHNCKTQKADLQIQNIELLNTNCICKYFPVSGVHCFFCLCDNCQIWIYKILKNNRAEAWLKLNTWLVLFYAWRISSTTGF